MITGELRSKVDKIWEIFWTGGITNPLSVIEQFTYLLFIKGLDDKQTDLEKSAEILGIEIENSFFNDEQQNLRWKNFKQLDAVKMYETMSKQVFPFIKQLDGKSDTKSKEESTNKETDKKNSNKSAFTKYMDDAIFMIPTPQMLEKIVTNIDALPIKEGSTTDDTKGDLYEYLLSKVATAGTNGQFRTPRHIIKMMVELMQPTPTDIIVDPAAGSAGFLVEAGEYLKKNNEDMFAIKELKDHYHNDMFFGNDMDRTMLRIGAMNMMLHGVERPNIEYRDSLSEINKDREKYTLVLANPPFKGSLDYDSVSADLLKVTKTKKTELLFLALFLRTLKKGGRCASIVPDGVLFGKTSAHISIRKEIVENHHLHAVISLPSGVFKPYASVSTAILIFSKTNYGGTDKVWFYDMRNDGFTLDDRRIPFDENDIPDIIKRYHNLEIDLNRNRDEQSFFVSIQELRKTDYDLRFNQYCLFEKGENGLATYEEIASQFKILNKLSQEKFNEIGRLLSLFKEGNRNHEYEEYTLGEILQYEQPTAYIVKSTNYDESYEVPVLTAGKSNLLGFTDETDGIYTDLPVIIFDDFTTASKYVDFNFKVKSSAMKMLTLKDENIADLKYIFYVMQNIHFDSTTHKRYWISEYSKIKIKLPKIAQQKEFVKQFEIFEDAKSTYNAQAENMNSIMQHFINKISN